VLAGHGYAVLAPNFRGSAGYGQAFLTANEDDFGGGDFADVMAGWTRWSPGASPIPAAGDHGVQLRGVHDGLGHRSDRPVPAAVAGAGHQPAELLRQFGYPVVHPGVSARSPWERPAQYAAQSPITYVGRVRTPTLIYHGDEDRRVPMEQSEQLYVSLRERGVPTELVGTRAPPTA